MMLKRSISVTLALTLSALGGVAITTGCAEPPPPKAPPPAPPPPPPDADGDGIADADDACPTEAEDGNPPDAKDGCPNKDLDGDGIALPADLCPDQKEVFNSFEDEDGCPDEKPMVQLTENDIEINQQILFENNSSDITEGSMPVVGAVAKVMVEHPEVALVQVGGHASATGDAGYNRRLTQTRVDSVVAALVAKGVDKARLLSQGYGYYCPLAEGDSEDAHQKNRRVEFKILTNKGKNTGVSLGCEEAMKHGIKPPKVPEPATAVAAAPAPAQGSPAPAAAAPAKPQAAPAPAAPAPAAAPASVAAAPAPVAAQPAPAAAPASKPGTPAKPATAPASGGELK